MPDTRTTRNLKHTSIHDHLLNNTACTYSTIDHTSKKSSLDTEHLSTISANTLHHDQKILTNNDDQHLLIEPSNDSMLSIDNNQQKLARIPSCVNQYSSAQTTGDTCQHMMKNAIKSSAMHLKQDIVENFVTFSGKKSEDAGKWLDHVFEVIEQQDLTPSEQRDIAARR